MSPTRATAVMRDHTVHERPSTPLELLFDLCFVVAVAFLAAELHHGLASNHTVSALTAYALLFVPIWWAWMSYTWFATAFSHDDAITRVLTFLQMGGILGVAAAVPSAVHGHLVPFAVAYAVMRLPLIVQWLRSAAADIAHRDFARTYAVGSTLAQVLWLVGAFVGGAVGAVIFVGALAVELATPVAAVRRSPDRVFHPGHIAERYGLFTIIVLGETILAVSGGLRGVIEGGRLQVDVLLVVGSALAIAAALWWNYFAALTTGALERHRKAAFVWGYGHYAIFAAIAAVGAAVSAVVDAVSSEASDHAAGEIGAPVAAAAVVITLLVLAALARVADPAASVGHLVVGAAIVAVAGAAWTALGPVLTLLIVAVVTAATVVAGSRAGGGSVPGGATAPAEGAHP